MDRGRALTIGLGALMATFALGIVVASFQLSGGRVGLVDGELAAVFAGISVALFASARHGRRSA